MPSRLPRPCAPCYSWHFRSFFLKIPPKTVPASGPPNPGGPKAHPSLVSFLIFCASGTLSQGGGPGVRPVTLCPLLASPHSPVPEEQLRELPASMQNPSRRPHPRLPPPTRLLRSSEPPCGFGSEPHPTPVRLPLGRCPGVQASLDFGRSSPSLPGPSLQLHPPQPWSPAPAPNCRAGLWVRKLTSLDPYPWVGRGSGRMAG